MTSRYKDAKWIYKLNILYTSPLRAKEPNVKWDQNLVNTNLEIQYKALYFGRGKILISK